MSSSQKNHGVHRQHDTCHSSVSFFMNIFYLHPLPEICAQQHVDKHVVKMILEYAQLLSTAHRVLDGTEIIALSNSGRRMKRWKLPDERDCVLYEATHLSHPSTIWARQSSANYKWLGKLFNFLLNEYTFRYGKTHATNRLLLPLFDFPIKIPVKTFTEPPSVMPEKFKVADDSVLSYRNYYQTEKIKLFSWKNRPLPDWLIFDQIKLLDK